MGRLDDEPASSPSPFHPHASTTGPPGRVLSGRGQEEKGSLSTLIRSYRRAAGLTQHELAVKAGLSIAAVRDFEQGRRSRPRTASLEALTAALGLDTRQVRTLERAARREHAPVSGYADGVVLPAGCDKGLWISVLGPLAVWRDGETVPLGSPARQVILGLLAVSAGMTVRRESVLDLLWGEQPPRTAQELVQAHVSRLRRVLWPGKGEDPDEGTIASYGGGYRLRVAGDELDLAVFGELARRAAAVKADGDLGTACGLYEQAFGLCRGEPCSNVSLLRDHPAMTDLRREVAEVLLSYAEVAGELGRHDLVLRRLRSLAAAEPLNERVHARLMVALAGCGQQAAALRAYEDLRQRLDRELGLYPGEELAATHLRLLRHDIWGAGPGPAPAASGPEDTAHSVPRQLPATPRYFTGRWREIRTLTNLVKPPLDAAYAIPVVALTGMAGIGKSALAVYWAHQVAGTFPDGQLFADLQGFSPIGVPMRPAEVLRGFLTALGVQDWRIPADCEGQRALYRSVLATRRVLIVLDNAQDAEQVRPLLPGAPGCLVLVTSRNRLTGLAASPGAHLLPLECLTVAQSRSLLARGLGEARVSAETRAVTELISLCARLPLALCNTIARAAAYPSSPLADLAAAMWEEQGRLDTLETGEKITSARMVFSWSHAKLSDRAERVFRLMALHPGPDITVPAAASLAGLTRRDAYLALAELADGYLITEHMPRRYACHDLLRVYAGEIALERESEPDRREAVHRVLDHYLQSAGVASRHVMQYRTVRMRPARSGVAAEEFHSAADAETWLRAERQVLLAAIDRAADEEFAPHAWELPWVAGPFLPGAACWARTAQALERALVTARRLGDIAGQAIAHQHLGWLRLRLGAYGSAHRHLEAAIRLACQLKDWCLAALSHLLRARVLRSQGRVSEGLLEAEESARLYRVADDRVGEFCALVEAGSSLAKLGDQNGAAAIRAQARELKSSFLLMSQGQRIQAM